MGWAALAWALALAAGGCARDATAPGSARAQAAFEAARARCGVTVAETDAVKACMRAQGFAYRHPWE